LREQYYLMEKEIKEDLKEKIRAQEIQIEDLKKQLANVILSQSHKESNSEAPNSSKRDTPPDSPNKLLITPLKKEATIRNSRSEIAREKSKIEQFSAQKGKSNEKSIIQSANHNIPDSSKNSKKHPAKNKDASINLHKDNLLPNRNRMPTQSETPSKRVRTVNKKLIEGCITPMKHKLPKTQITSPKDQKHKKTNHSRNNLHSNAKSQKINRPMETMMLESHLIEDNNIGIDFTTPHFNPEATFSFKDLLKSV